MAIVTLSFTGSEEEIASGIPKYMTIESNIPATIYYTLDGSTPTFNSSIYIDTFGMPDAMTSVILSAFGVDGLNNIGPILTQTFSADVTRVTVARNVGMEGFVLNRANMGPDYPDRYGPDGYVATFLDVDPETLDIIRKEHGINGIEPGTVIEIGYPIPSDPWTIDETEFVPFSSPEKAQFFNPHARMIVIDNRKNNEINLTLRPFGSLSNIYKEFGGKRIREAADDATYVSGGFVRRFYDAKNNIMVSYYFDHNESRYIKNIQALPSNIKVTNIGLQASASLPLVFQWIYRGRQSSI